MNENDTAVVELPTHSTPDFEAVSLEASRFEWLRTTLARKLMLRHTYIANTAIWLVPDDHPWKALAKSAREDFRCVTHVGLRPRRNGQIEVGLADLETMDDRSIRARKIAGAAVGAWLTLDLLSYRVPGPLSPLPIDDAIRLFSRIASVLGMGA